jgi:integrase
MLQKPKAIKPDKPSPDFPLSPHGSGKWCKKIGGKLYYFGRWDDPWGALREYEQHSHSSACKPNEEPTTSAGITLYDALNEFLAAKEQAVQSGNIVKRTYDEYVGTSVRMSDVLGAHRLPNELTPQSYAAYRAWLVEKGYGIVTISNEITRVKVAMNWIYRTYYPDRNPQFGPAFDKQSNTSMRRHKAEQRSKLLEPETILSILDESGIHFRAMILLGINCGFGPTDCARLPLSVAQEAIRTGWLVFPRTKTFVPREAALWPETVDALRASVERRPKPKAEFAKLCFINADGGSYDPSGDGTSQLVQGRWKAAKKQARLEHGSFYCLRHTFNSIAEQTGDQIAVKLVMGHSDNSMSANYRHAVGKRSIADDRLIRVAKMVRDWLGLSNAQVAKNPSPIV